MYILLLLLSIDLRASDIHIDPSMHQEDTALGQTTSILLPRRYARQPKLPEITPEEYAAYQAIHDAVQKIDVREQHYISRLGMITSTSRVLKYAIPTAWLAKTAWTLGPFATQEGTAFESTRVGEWALPALALTGIAAAIYCFVQDEAPDLIEQECQTQRARESLNRCSEQHSCAQLLSFYEKAAQYPHKIPGIDSLTPCQADRRYQHLQALLETLKPEQVPASSYFSSRPIYCQFQD